MQPITFTNGNRIFTPSVQSQQVQLTDLNGDGEIDILDAAQITSNPGGILVVNPPTIEAEDPFDFTKTCPEGQELTVITHGPGIITTGCNAITNTDGIVDFPENTADYLSTITNFLDEVICDHPKVRGLAIQYDEQGKFDDFYTTDCVCAEAGVNMLEVLEKIGDTLLASKRMVNSVRYFASATLSKLIARRNVTSSLLSRVTGRLAKLGEKIANKNTIIDNIINQIKALDLNLPQDRLKFTKLTNRLTEHQSELDVLKTEYNRYSGGYPNIEAASDKLNDAIGRIQDSSIFKGTLLDGPKSAVHYVALAYGALYLIADSMGINFVVPKFCGDGGYVVLDDNCNCVPKSSGSYASSYTNNTKILKEYSLIETL